MNQKHRFIVLGLATVLPILCVLVACAVFTPATPTANQGMETVAAAFTQTTSKSTLNEGNQGILPTLPAWPTSIAYVDSTSLGQDEKVDIVYKNEVIMELSTGSSSTLVTMTLPGLTTPFPYTFGTENQEAIIPWGPDENILIRKVGNGFEISITNGLQFKKQTS